MALDWKRPDSPGHPDYPSAIEVNRDPVGEAGGENLYAFVGNDPVNSHDLLGMLVVVFPGAAEYPRSRPAYEHWFQNTDHGIFHWNDVKGAERFVHGYLADGSSIRVMDFIVRVSEGVDSPLRGPEDSPSGGAFLVTVTERMETAEEAIARLSGPRGYAATRAGQFSAWADNRFKRATDPLYASLQDAVHFGVMPWQSAQAMLDARQMKEEWEAENVP
ncbi:MAG: hypothetical protein JJU00_00005 [Opitutales bacterium]|nr:hypothetical protein [Opitutales bacterium]